MLLCLTVCVRSSRKRAPVPPIRHVLPSPEVSVTARLLVLSIVAMSIMSCPAEARECETLFGNWRFDADRSTQIAAWSNRVPRLEIRDRGNAVPAFFLYQGQ